MAVRMSVRRRSRLVSLLAACPVLVAGITYSADDLIAEGFVAGTAPHQRPASAPRVTAYEKSQQWYAAATKGVEQPLPASLRFLENQGAWFTPFTRPGMPGPYDLRGLHSAAAKPTPQKK